MVKEVPDSAIRQEKREGKKQVGEEEITLSLFTDNVNCLSRKSQEIYQKKVLKVISELVGHRIEG